jgi:hypothetical protein
MKYETESPQVKIFADWAIKNVKRFIASEAHCYSERLWVGGITDCIAELNDGKLAIIDFKSSKEAYLSQFIQIAGYDIEVSENGLFDDNGNSMAEIPADSAHKLDGLFDCYIVFPFGAEKVEPQYQYDAAAMKKGFEAASVLYKLINNK